MDRLREATRLRGLQENWSDIDKVSSHVLLTLQIWILKNISPSQAKA